MTLENKYLLEQNLNTSYVTVKPAIISTNLFVSFDLNTSYVTVKQINKINKMPNVSNLNTSYVTVKQTMEHITLEYQ